MIYGNDQAIFFDSWTVDCSPEVSDAADDSGLSTGAIAGIAVGAVAGVALIGTAAYFAVKKNAGKNPFI